MKWRDAKKNPPSDYETEVGAGLYDWVLVCGGRDEDTYSFARWDGEKWELYGEDNGPWGGDAVGDINANSIIYWMSLPYTPRSKKIEKNLEKANRYKREGK